MIITESDSKIKKQINQEEPTKRDCLIEMIDEEQTMKNNQFRIHAMKEKMKDFLSYLDTDWNENNDQLDIENSLDTPLNKKIFPSLILMKESEESEDINKRNNNNLKNSVNSECKNLGSNQKSNNSLVHCYHSSPNKEFTINQDGPEARGMKHFEEGGNYCRFLSGVGPCGK